MSRLPPIDLLDAYDGERAGARVGWSNSVVQMVLQRGRTDETFSIWLTPTGAEAIAHDLLRAARRSVDG